MQRRGPRATVRSLDGMNVFARIPTSPPLPFLRSARGFAARVIPRNLPSFPARPALQDQHLLFVEDTGGMLGRFLLNDFTLGLGNLLSKACSPGREPAALESKAPHTS
jgi:hypothetical protein